MASNTDHTAQSITAGVKHDIERLLKSFTELNTVRYEEFANLWRAHKMSLLCAGRISDADAREFMEEVFKVTLQFYLPPYTFQTRIGALYTLYGLYFTQPCVPKVLIRVTCSHWNEIVKFQDEIKKESHHDVTYIFIRLYQEGAFVFVALMNEMIKGRQLDTGATSGARELRDDLLISDVFSADTLRQLSSLHSQYDLTKTLLAGPGASRPDRSLSMTNSKLVPDIIKALDTFYDSMKKHGASVESREDLGAVREEAEASELRGRGTGREDQSRRRGRGRRGSRQAESSTSPPKKVRKPGRVKRSMITDYQQDSDEDGNEEEGREEAGVRSFVNMPSLESSDDNSSEDKDSDNEKDEDYVYPVGRAGKGGRGYRGGGKAGRGRGQSSSSASS